MPPSMTLFYDRTDNLAISQFLLKLNASATTFCRLFFHSDLLASEIGSATFCCPFFWKRTAKSRKPFFVLQMDAKKTPKRCQKVSNLFWTPKGSRAKKSAKSRGTCIHLQLLSVIRWLQIGLKLV